MEKGLFGGCGNLDGKRVFVTSQVLVCFCLKTFRSSAGALLFPMSDVAFDGWPECLHDSCQLLPLTVM